MGWTLEIGNQAGSAWTDISDVVDRTTLRMGGQAANGEAGTGYGFDYADDAAEATLPARRVLRFTIGATVVGRGRIASKGIGRGTMPVDDSRSFDVIVGDGNMHLQGIPVHGWERPSETDVARMQALVAAFLSGSPRASTDLADTYISASNPVDLPAKTYDATNPLGVVGDIVRVTGKLAFITADDEVFYDEPDSLAYAAGLAVTDDDPNETDEFAPIVEDSPGTQDGTELYTGLRLLYGADEASVHDSDAAAEAAHDFWEEVVYSDAETSAEATRELAETLDASKVEEERFTFGVRLTEDEIGLLLYGQTLSFRCAAAGVLTPRVIRAGRIEYEEEGDGIWIAWVEGTFPRKLAARLSRNAMATKEGVRRSVDTGTSPFVHYRCTETFPEDVPVGLGQSSWPGNPSWTSTEDVEDQVYVSEGTGFFRVLVGNETFPEMRVRLDELCGLPIELVYESRLVEQHVGICGTAVGAGFGIFWRNTGGVAVSNVFRVGHFLGFTHGICGFPFTSPTQNGIIGPTLESEGSRSEDDVANVWWKARWLIESDRIRFRRWKVVDVEPDTWDNDFAHAIAEGFGPGYSLCISGGGQTLETDEFMDGADIRNLEFVQGLCYCSDAGADEPLDGQWIFDELVSYGDDTTTTFNTRYPYAVGSLVVKVDRKEVGSTPTDPSTGEFEIGFAPVPSERVRASYRVDL